MVMVEAHLIEALERFPEPVALYNGFVIQPWKGRFVLTCHDDPVVTISPNELGGAYPARDSQYAVALIGERLLTLVNFAAVAYARGRQAAGGHEPAEEAPAPTAVADLAVPAAVAAAAAMPAASLDDILGGSDAEPVEDLSDADEGDPLFDEFDSDDNFDNVTPPPSDSVPDAQDDDFAEAVASAEEPAPEPAPEPEAAPVPEPESEAEIAADDGGDDDFNIDDLPDSVDVATDEDGAPAEAEIQGEMPAADEPLDQSAIDDLFG